MTSSVNDESRGHDDSESGAELNNPAEESILNLLVDRGVYLFWFKISPLGGKHIKFQG